MENTQYPQEDSPSTIYFVEEMKPEYLEYIDSCKERAQSDSAYWQELKESMSRGMIQLADNDDMSEHDDTDNTDNTDNTDADTQYDESNMSADGVSEESIRSLLEYQIKMLENMNYAIDMLTEKCDELTKYCSKLAKRLKKYNCSGVSNPIDVSGIINSNIPAVNKVNNAPVIVPIQNKSLQQSNVSARVPVQVPVQVPTQAHANTHVNTHANALTFTRVSDQSVTDETDNSDDDFTETNSVKTDVENIENTDVKQVDL